MVSGESALLPTTSYLTPSPPHTSHLSPDR